MTICQKAGVEGYGVDISSYALNKARKKLTCELKKLDLEKAGFSRVEIKGCLLFGFPPGLDCRHYLRKLKWPVLTKPIFFSIKGLTPELFIFTRKED